MRSTTNHLPVPDYLTTLVDQVHASGHFLAMAPQLAAVAGKKHDHMTCPCECHDMTGGSVHPGRKCAAVLADVVAAAAPVQRFQHIAGMSRKTGALQGVPGSLPLSYTDPVVPRDGFVLMALETGQTQAQTALLMAGVTQIAEQDIAGRDLFTILTDELAGRAPVPTGTGDLTRPEVKKAFYTMCYSGTGFKVNATPEELRTLAAVTALTWVLPELAAAADKDGFLTRVHREHNDTLWRLFAAAHGKLIGIAHAVGLGIDEVFLEVAPADVDEVRARVDGMSLKHMSVRVVGPTTQPGGLTRA